MAKKIWSKGLLKIVLIAAILVAAIAGTQIMIALKKPPVRVERPPMIPLLNACEVSVEHIQMVVSGSGTVQSRMDVQVVPQVSGRVSKCHPDFIDGGFFSADEPLIVIDQRDYALAVEQADAEVARAQVQVEQEEAEADVARREWDQLHPGMEPTSPLVLRQPQIRNAQASLKAAQAKLEKAKLDLERTEISMPFSGRVVSSRVDVGQYVVAGQSIGTVYRTDIVEIVVPLENSELEWLSIPNGENSTSDSLIPATVIANFAGKQHTWEGVVARTRGQIDPTSRMVYVVVEVLDPFARDPQRPALVPGMFVQVELLGRVVDSLVRIPRYALHTGNEVWLANDNRLHITDVQVIRLDKQYAYIASGLNNGDIVITSPLETVANGMKIRTQLETDF